MTVQDVARLLTVSGPVEVTTDDIRADIAEGAPTRPDGTVNFVEYTAWLLQKRKALRDRRPPPSSR